MYCYNFWFQFQLSRYIKVMGTVIAANVQRMMQLFDIFGKAKVPGMIAEAPRQGLTLVHFSAQLKRFLCDRGCV
jgi:hypothetical protein